MSDEKKLLEQIAQLLKNEEALVELRKAKVFDMKGNLVSDDGNEPIISRKSNAALELLQAFKDKSPSSQQKGHTLNPENVDDSGTGFIGHQSLIARHLDAVPKSLKHAMSFGTSIDTNGKSGKADEPYIHGDSHNLTWRNGNRDTSHGQGDMWNQPNPMPVDPKNVELGGVLGKGVPQGNGPDPFMWMDARYGATKQLLADHAKSPLKIHTRSDLIARDDYMQHLHPDFHEINIHIPHHMDERLTRMLEPGAPSISRRLAAAKKLNDDGHKVNIVYDRFYHPGAAGVKNISQPSPEAMQMATSLHNRGVGQTINKIHISPDAAKRIDRATGMSLKGLAKAECWDGYKRVPGTKPYAKGSCEPTHKAEELDKAAGSLTVGPTGAKGSPQKAGEVVALPGAQKEPVKQSVVQTNKNPVIELFPRQAEAAKQSDRAQRKHVKPTINQPEKEYPFATQPVDPANKPGVWATDKGISEAGAHVRDHNRLTPDERHFEFPMSRAKDKHKQIIQALMAQKKPNLTRAEKSVHAKDPILNPKAPPKAMSDKQREEWEARIKAWMDKKSLNKSTMHSAIKEIVGGDQKPHRQVGHLKVIKAEGNHEDIVAGVKVPHELKSHTEPVPYEHPHREIASKFVSDVHKKNRAEGIRMSDKYLGIGAGGVPTHPNGVHPDKRASFVPTGSKVQNRGAAYGVIKSENSEVTGRMMALKDIVDLLHKCRK